MQACLDRLAGTISAAYDLCPPSGGQPVPVLWMRNKMLVSAADVAAATRALNSLPVDGVSDVTEYLDGAGNTAFGLFEATVTGMKVDKEFMDNLEKANIDSRSQGGPLMSLNFVYSVSQVWRFHPYGAPDEVPEAEAPALPAAASGGPTIDVFDSLYPTNPLLTPNWPGPSENATTLAYPSTRPTTPYPAYGHGPFVTSLIKRSAPTANVRAFGIAQNVDTQGVFITAADVQAAMSAAFGQVNDPTAKPQFTGPVPDIVNLSLGGPGCGVTAPAPLGEFLNLAATPGEWSLDLTKAPVIVAAAGNSSAKVEDYPAAFSGVLHSPHSQYHPGSGDEPRSVPGVGEEDRRCRQHEPRRDCSRLLLQCGRLGQHLGGRQEPGELLPIRFGVGKVERHQFLCCTGKCDVGAPGIGCHAGRGPLEQSAQRSHPARRQLPHDPDNNRADCLSKLVPCQRRFRVVLQFSDVAP